MRRNLLAMLLAVVMIAAVVFIAAPTAKAAEVHTAEADDAEINAAAGDTVDLAGKKNVKITVTGDGAIYLIDTGNLDDLSGDAAGTAKVTGTVADWVQHTGGFKYLALENADGTYSAHPFNITVDKYGVNTHYSAISVRVAVIANDVVAKLIDAGEFGMHNYSLANTENADKEYSPHWYNFADENGNITTNGLYGYFYLENSLASGVLTDNLFAQIGAYIKIGDLTIESNTKVNIYPKTILTDLNNKVVDEPTLFTEDQKANMVELLNKEGNDYLKSYCGNFLPAEPVYVWELVTDVSALVAGDKIVIVAKDSNYAMSTTQNNNNRGQATVTKDGNIITFGDDVQVLTLDAGNVANTFAFNTGSGYLCAASSSSNYLRTETALSNNSSWNITIAADGTATVVAQGSYSRNTMQYNQSSSIFACYSSASQKAMVIYKSVISCEHTYDDGVVTAPTCTEDGYTTQTCSLCGSTTKVEIVPALGHSYAETSRTDATCTEAGSITNTCSVCGSTETVTGDPATGHTVVDGKCTNSGCDYEETGTEKHWTLVTDVSTLKAGDQVVIVANTKNYAMSTTQNGNNRGQTDITKNNDNTLNITDSVQILTLEAGKASGTFAFNTGSGYLYAASSSKNYLRTETTLSDNSSWSISITPAGVATITAQGTNTRNLLKYNSSSSIFSCYASGQLDVSIYVYQ